MNLTNRKVIASKTKKNLKKFWFRGLNFIDDNK